MSKFLFHLKFSQKENYVHEHELYEVMRSRNLYQVQFEVRSNFKKRMRNIEISEKAHINGFHNSRNVFIQKMKERMEQADRSRKRTTRHRDKSFSKLFAKENKIVRRYTSDFPDLVEKLATPVEQPLPAISPTIISPGIRSRRGTGTTRRSSSSFLSNAPETPSMAATIYVDNSSLTQQEKERENKRNKAFITSKVVVAGKSDHVTNYKEKRDEEDSTSCSKSETRNKIRHSSPYIASGKVKEDDLLTTEEIRRDESKVTDTSTKLPRLAKTEILPSNPGSKLTESIHMFDAVIQEEESKVNDQITSFVLLPDHLTTTENLDSDTASQKVVEWATAHNLLSKSEKESEEEKTFRRLLIDRPSKWAFSHIHESAIHESSTFDTQNFNVHPGRRKSRVVEFVTEKSKAKATVSLPAIDTTVRRKPLVCMEPGGLTPDGRLILTQGDYDAYLSGYRRARNMRLNMSKKKSKTLKKMVDKFQISPKQRLRDETRLLIVQSEC